MSKKLKAIKLIIFCCIFYNIVPSISQTVASSITIQAKDIVTFDNIIQHENPIKISPIFFEDYFGNKVKLNDYSGKLVILNFWATWCAPCKEEMPSLDTLSQNKNFRNLAILPVNMEKVNYKKTKKFFSNLKIKKLEIFFDPNLNFVKELKLRGVPTSVIIDKEGREIARIMGSIDFENKNFLKWLLNYD